MDNQQPKASDIEKAWLAGFIDGEGSLMMGKRKDLTPHGFVRKKEVLPKLALSNTNIETLDYLVSLLNRLGLPYNIVWREWKNPKYKKAWDLRVTGLSRMRKWLLIIKPYLITKSRQAELLWEWIESRRQTDNQKKPYTAREWQILQEMSVINH